MISISGMSGNLAMRLVDATESKEQVLLRSQPQNAREIEYFRENIDKVDTVDDLIGDYRLYSFVMKAHDLEDQIFGKAMMEKILKSNIEEDDALVNKLTDSRFKELYNTMGFGTDGVGNINTMLGNWKNRMVDKFIDTQYVNGKADENEAVGIALEFRRKAADVSSAYEILADADMATFVRTALGLPAVIAGLDIDRQAALINERLDLESLQDPEAVEKLVTRYMAISDATSDLTTNNAALQILSNNVTSGSFVPVTIDITAVTGFSPYKAR
ncbi:DUF1217 domain-containing protein [Marinovum sp.]|uniref:DUF1217 domain-containing protein n=1 Tax=Marinovum sp. TaxID=2024839 RepID=UPI002B270F7D|nr:DUF1217 domain-containing protein [Marinovum sp.]